MESGRGGARCVFFVAENYLSRTRRWCQWYFNPFMRPPESTRLAAWCYSPPIVGISPFSTIGYHLVRIMRHLTAIALFISAATGCAVVPAQQSNNEPAVQGQIHDEKALASEANRTSELLFHYLLGDIASRRGDGSRAARSEEHTSELQSQAHTVCRLLL